MSRNLTNKYMDGHVVTDDDLQIIGRNLWNGLSAEARSAFEVARKAAGEKILPVVIHSDAADVQALPWETLFHPTYGFIGKNPDFTLTHLDKGPLRVLLFTSLPANVDPERSRLKVEEEQAEIQAALLPWIAQGLVTLEMPDDGRFSTLQNLLKEFQFLQEFEKLAPKLGLLEGLDGLDTLALHIQKGEKINVGLLVFTGFVQRFFKVIRKLYKQP